MNSVDDIQKILTNFNINRTVKAVSPVKKGLINSTYVVTLSDDSKYLLQNINVNVFKKPDELMENISGITAFLKEKIKAKGGNPDRETITFLPAHSGKYFYLDEKNRYWRVYYYQDNSFTNSSVDNPEIMLRVGEAFGKFQAMLADYPTDKLYDTIPDFHNTAKRYNTLKKSVEENLSGRKESCIEEIEFALSLEEDAKRLVQMYEAGKLPLRVTHNDTKVNNVLFDKDSNEAFCVIDLDTVMPGLSLYDFGDAIRSGAANIIEDSDEYEKCGVRLDLYESYTRGYLSAAAQALTEDEVAQLAFSAKLLTYECGIRFLSDYLDGDVYFRTDYPEHNLVRAKNQFAMVRDIERKMAELEQITQKAYKEAVKA